MDGEHADEFLSRTRQAERYDTRPTKGNVRRPPKSDAHKRAARVDVPAGGSYFLPFFFLALLPAGGSRLGSAWRSLSSWRSRLSSHRSRLRSRLRNLSSVLAYLTARQLAKMYLRRNALGVPLLPAYLTAACLNRQTKAWNSPASGHGVGSLLVTLLPDAVTGGSPTRPWSVKGAGSASSLRFAVPQLSLLLSAKTGAAVPKVAGAVFPAMLAAHSGGPPRQPKGAGGPLGTLSRRASSGGLTRLPKAGLDI